MSTSLSQLVAAYLEWTGLRHELTGPAKHGFARWVAEERSELARPYTGRMAEFSLQCKEVKRLCSGPAPERGIGPETLKKYMKELVAIYRAMPEKDRPTFIDFLDSVRNERHSKRALETYVKECAKNLHTEDS